MKLVFMGTPRFATPSLERLISEGHRIAAVYTRPDRPAGRGGKVVAPPAKALALKNGIPVRQPARIKNNDQVRSDIEQIAPDACVVVAYGKILPEWLLEIPRLGCINVHASLLPAYRGAAPVNWAIANGERITGITIMQMDAGMDTGPILARQSVEIGETETAPELSARLAELGAGMLVEALPLVERGLITPLPQDDSQATYAPILKREDGLVDWSLSARQIADRVRGFSPWPGQYSNLRGRRLLVRQASATAARTGEPPAAIVSIEPGGINVACGDGSVLRLERVQVEGRRELAAFAFANGARLAVGDRLSNEST